MSCGFQVRCVLRLGLVKETSKSRPSCFHLLVMPVSGVRQRPWASESACFWAPNAHQRQPASVGVVTVAGTGFGLSHRLHDSGRGPSLDELQTR